MILPDTHAFLWFFTGNRRLGRFAQGVLRRAIANEDAAFSAISLWEIGMLQQKNRLNIVPNLTAGQWRERLLAEGLREIPVDSIIAVRAGDLPDMHGDPADRIIVASAFEGGHRLFTGDRNILDWPHELDRFDARR